MYWFYKENQDQSFGQEGWIMCMDSRGSKQACPEIWAASSSKIIQPLVHPQRKKKSMRKQIHELLKFSFVFDHFWSIFKAFTFHRNINFLIKDSEKG